MPLSFGVLLLQERPVHEVLGWASRFDEAGVDSVWTADHLAFPQDVARPWYHGWDLLAAIAGVTKRCRIGPLVTTYQYRSPLAMARHVVTVDALCAGRLDLGVGAGGAPVDRAFGGIPDRSISALVDRLDAGLTTTLALLDGHRVALPAAPVLRGMPGPADIALNTPFPQVGRLPIVVGGYSPRSVDVAAKHAHRWNTYGTRPHGGDVFEAWQRTSEQLSQRCLERGRDPREVTRSALLDFNPQAAAANPQALAELVERLYALGFEECIAYAWNEGFVERSPEALLSFVVDDLPKLKGRLA
jgi:alkanesulfonate monooxygenase SsuD/methylene tetrahydromethanopterin reductase-like flavin-dependent oxidoreductase (luciferase family)